MEDKKRNGRRNAEPIDLEEQYEELSEEEYEPCAEEENEEECEQCEEEEAEEEYEECNEEGADEEADSSDEDPFSEEYCGYRVRRFTPDIPPFLRNRRSAAENNISEEQDEEYDEYSGIDDYYEDYEEETEKHWELPFIAKAALVVLGIIGMIAGFIFLFSEPEVEESYQVGMGRAPEVVYVPVGGSVTFTVQAGEEDLAWLDEKGRVNIGVENVELTAQTEGAACTLTAAKAEDPAHRSNPQTYTVTGEASGTMIATFDLSYDRYRVSKNGEFDTVPSEVYELMPWTTVVISVYPPSAEITIPFEKVTVSAGASFDLQTQVAPEDVKYAQIVYVSSNPSVAQADESGVVETFEEGTAVITAQMSDGSGTTASCTVEVLPARKLPEAEK